MPLESKEATGIVQDDGRIYLFVKYTRSTTVQDITDEVQPKIDELQEDDDDL